MLDAQTPHPAPLTLWGPPCLFGLPDPLPHLPAHISQTFDTQKHKHVDTQRGVRTETLTQRKRQEEAAGTSLHTQANADMDNPFVRGTCCKHPQVYSDRRTQTGKHTPFRSAHQTQASQRPPPSVSSAVTLGPVIAPDEGAYVCP